MERIPVASWLFLTLYNEFNCSVKLNVGINAYQLIH